MPDNKSPTAPNLWMQSAMTSVEQPNTSHNGNGHKPPTPSKDCPNCTWQHPASRTNCPAQDSHCSKFNKIGHWGLKCHGGKPPQPKNAPPPRNAPPPGSQHGKSRCPPRSHNHCPGRGGKTDAIDVGKDHSPQDEIALYGIQPNVTTVATAHATGNTKGVTTYDELFIDAINYGTIGNTHPKEIMVGDVRAPQCNEAYTTVQLPASASRKGTASLYIKVDTRAGGNVLPLHVFWHLYLNQISPAGLPTGLDHVSTRLSAYSGSHIPLYGALCGPITWWPGHLGTWPHLVNHTGTLQTPWSCHPGCSLMQKASSHEDELCHHSHVTWHKTPKSWTCFHNSNNSQACYSPHCSQVHQLHWWLDKGIPRLIHRNW